MLILKLKLLWTFLHHLYKWRGLHSTSKWNVICPRLQETTTNLRKHTDTIQKTKANSNDQNWSLFTLSRDLIIQYMNEITFYNLNIQDHNDECTTIGLLLLAIYNKNILSYGKAIQTNKIANYSSYKLKQVQLPLNAKTDSKVHNCIFTIETFANEIIPDNIQYTICCQ